MAAFASQAAGDGMTWAIRLYSLGKAASAVGGPDPGKLINYLGEGNMAIFLDMYPQMLAYKAGGLTNIQDMLDAGQIKQSQFDAWHDIDDGIKDSDSAKIWDGSELLAQVEQLETLQAVLDKDEKLWASATSFALNPWAIESPIPGDDSTFQGFSPGTSFGDGQARFQWFKVEMLPAWKRWRTTYNNIDLKTLHDGGYK